MRHIIRGVPTGDAGLADALKDLPGVLAKDLAMGTLTPETVIAAADTISRTAKKEEIAALSGFSDMGKEAAICLAEDTLLGLNRDSLQKKLLRELHSVHPFEYGEVGGGILERYAPLGVLTHIAAGNAAGLPAMSVLEGLLAGNINLLKLPGNDGGISALLLSKLIEAEPSLAPYIYVFDIPSQDTENIKKLIDCSDAVAVWGSDAAVEAVRKNTPPNIPVIEWGHRLSFGYVAKNGGNLQALEGFAVDICETEQLLCSAPQCIFYETEDKGELLAFAGCLAGVLRNVSARYPVLNRDVSVEAGITAAAELVRMEEIIGEKALLRGKDLNWSVLVDYRAELKPSPMFRNIWVMPLPRRELYTVLRKMKGYLQTAGLCCPEEERGEITELMIRAGVNRITPPGKMSHVYTGEPHDGTYALSRYTRRISIKKPQTD